MTNWKYQRNAAIAALIGVAISACGVFPRASDPEEPEDTPERKIGVEITGVEHKVADNVLAHLSIANKPCSVAGAYLRILRERAVKESSGALQALGYYSPTIEVAIEPATDCPIVQINVDVGDPVLLDNVVIQLDGPARDDAEFQEQISAINLVNGAQLNHQDYTDAKRLIESVALDRGYLEGLFTKHEIRVDPAHDRAEITLVFNSGPRYVIGDINIQQVPDFLDEDLIRRFLEDRGGEAYNASIVSGFHQALASASYFGRVDVRPRLTSRTDQSIPIDIELTPRAKHTLDTGIGVSTDEGIRGRFGYKNHRLNRFGHQFEFNTNASFIEQQLSAIYRVPRAHPSDEWLSLQAGLRRRDVDTFDTVEAQVVLSETKRRRWGWMETRFLEWNREDYDVSGTNETAMFLAPGVSWRRTVSNDSLFPTRGYDINLEFKAAADAVLSDTSFIRSLFSTKFVYGLPLQTRVLLRAALGAMWVDEFRLLPPSERFFAGGDNSVRGYDIDSRGPLDASNDVIGGTYLGVASVEIDHYFTSSWGLAAFVDTGNAFGGDGQSTGLQTAVGLGLRWRSPIGPVRVDVAHPLDDTDNDFRIHLRIGPDL